MMDLTTLHVSILPVLLHLLHMREWYVLCTLSRSCRSIWDLWKAICKPNSTLVSPLDLFIRGFLHKPVKLWTKSILSCPPCFHIESGQLFAVALYRANWDKENFHIPEYRLQTVILNRMDRKSSSTKIAPTGMMVAYGMDIEGNRIISAHISGLKEETKLSISISTGNLHRKCDEVHQELATFVFSCRGGKDCSLMVCSDRCYVYTIETTDSHELVFNIFCVEPRGEKPSCVHTNTVTVGGFSWTASYSLYTCMRGYAFPGTCSTPGSDMDNAPVSSSVEHILVFGVRDSKIGHLSMAVRVNGLDEHTVIDVSEENRSVFKLQQKDTYIVIDQVTRCMVLMTPTSYQPTPDSSFIPLPGGIEIGCHAYQHTQLRNGVLGIGSDRGTTFIGLDQVPYTPIPSPW